MCGVGMVVLSQSEPGLVIHALLLFITFVGITFYFLFLTGEQDNDARPFFFPQQNNDFFVRLPTAMLEYLVYESNVYIYLAIKITGYDE